MEQGRKPISLRAHLVRNTTKVIVVKGRKLFSDCESFNSLGHPRAAFSKALERLLEIVLSP